MSVTDTQNPGTHPLLTNLSFATGSRFNNITWMPDKKPSSLKAGGTIGMSVNKFPPLQSYFSEARERSLESKAEIFKQMQANRNMFLKKEMSHIRNFQEI